ncbi:NitT/TauT family transport system substrate-binding protein [Raoultella sp. BIGb0138]|uniref:ABC transporter substrate-binding protein n=1 Tax=Raoultella sp. BIGb0138 TaxID=2485115 RepID=UPI001053907F|nr:ABC transporter substrate-binding protein [Raoultella sp. BIGb0138]TCW17646.1 NitT/TauT family transport system substrate-binding protein [Raoultella sp. BIGb0138]
MCLMCDAVSRRDFLKLSALLSAGAALPLIMQQQARAAAEPDAPVRVGYLPITDAAPLLVAHGLGLFDKAGVKAERPVMFRSWSQLTEAFIAGRVNVIHMLSPVTIWARFQAKLPAKVVAWNHTNGSALTVAPQISRPEELEGKTVAVPFWYSIHNVVLQQILRSAGLQAVTGTPGKKQVRLLVLPPADMVPALAAGQIQGFIVAEPFNALAEARHVGRILRFTGDVWQNHACCVVMMHESDLTTRPAWSQSVTDALVNAQLWIRQHRAETAQLLGRGDEHHYTPHDAEVLRQVLLPTPAMQAGWQKDGAIRHEDWHQQRIDFQPWPYGSYFASLTEQLKLTVMEGNRDFLEQLDAQQVAAELVEPEFVRQSIARAGGMTAFGLADQAFDRKETIAP